MLLWVGFASHPSASSNSIQLNKHSINTNFKYFVAAILLFSSCGVVYAQKIDTTLIILWSDKRKLNIKDFKVATAKNNVIKKNVSALTRTGITYHLSATTRRSKASVNVVIYTTVHKANTFISERALQMPAHRISYLLNHEQKHFDISEVFAREATRGLATLKLTRNYKNEIARFVKEKFTEYEHWQQLYDKETNNGQHEEAQEEWDKKITGRLTELEAYKTKSIKRVVD